MYQCKKCGRCCSNVGQSEIYSDLDRGDGKCKFFNEDTNLCMPMFDEVLEKDLAEHKIFLGGCMVTGECEKKSGNLIPSML